MRKDLLYLGTETGFYLSFNGGQRWQKLQLNLPLTPITDLKVHRNDLIASTAGRAFWILDDLSPLQQRTDGTVTTDVRLFKPRPAYRTQAFGGGFGAGSPRAGRSAPNGAVIDFWMSKVPEGDVGVDVLDTLGSFVGSEGFVTGSGGRGVFAGCAEAFPSSDLRLSIGARCPGTNVVTESVKSAQVCKTTGNCRQFEGSEHTLKLKELDCGPRQITMRLPFTTSAVRQVSGEEPSTSK